MSERSENLITWNVPNVITIWLMLALLWVLMGIASHLVRRKTTGTSTVGVKTDENGSFAS